MEKVDFKKITAQYMKEYIEKNAPEDKAWFKSIAFDSNNKYQHLIAKRKFAEKYMPEIIPIAKPKEPKKSEMFKDW